MLCLYSFYMTHEIASNISSLMPSCCVSLLAFSCTLTFLWKFVIGDFELKHTVGVRFIIPKIKGRYHIPHGNQIIFFFNILDAIIALFIEPLMKISFLFLILQL